MKRGLLIVDRGSREREAGEELEKICGAVKERGRYDYADYCFLEVEPPFIEDGMPKALKEGLDSLTVVPYFLYPGRKVKAAVAEAMSYQKKTGTKLRVTRPMSMHPTMVELVDGRIREALAKDGPVSRERVDVLVVGHGSRDPNAQISLRYVTDGLAKTGYKSASHCFLEIEQPDIAAGVRTCATKNPEALVVVFYFLHEGAHVKTDINADLLPVLDEVGLPRVCVTRHLGADERMIELILERAEEVEVAD